MKVSARFLAIAVFGLCSAIVLSSCGKKETPATGAAQDKTKTTVEKIGSELNSAADYATGKTQLEIKKNKTKQLQDIQNKANSQLEDALKE